MKILGTIFSPLLSAILNNPTGTAAASIFGLGFLLVAGNAIHGQPHKHPQPLYETSAVEQEQALVKQVSVQKQPVNITHSVLTQRVSIANIPVPTANPARVRAPKSVAAHSSLVRDVQAALSKAGFYDGKIDGIYGSKTRQSIVDYQQQAGILPDGEASFGLLTTLRSASAVVAQSGSVSETSTAPGARIKPVAQPQLLVFDTETVAKIQAGLRENFAEDQISVDGLLGRQTRNAVRRFQERFKLQATGELNEETMRKMVSVGIISSI